MAKIMHFYVDGDKFYECDEKGAPINNERMRRRDLKERESVHEKLYLKKINYSRFDEQKSKASKWISFTMETGKPSHALARSFAKLFSKLMGENLPREIYRRKRCCLLWIEGNIEKINEICKRKEIFAIETQKNVPAKVYKIISPEKSMELINGSKRPQDIIDWFVPTKTDYTPPQFFPISIIA